MRITAEYKGAHDQNVSVSLTNDNDLDACEMATMLYNLMRAIDYAEQSINEAFMTVAEERGIS